MNKNRIDYLSDDFTKHAGPTYRDHLSGGRSDGRIHEEICGALLNDPYVDVADIEIEVAGGVVTLKGRAASRAIKRDAEVCIEHIEGIKDIFNLITLNEFEDSGHEGLVKHQAQLE